MNENIFKNSLIVNQLKLVRYCCEYDKSLYNEEYLVNTTTVPIRTFYFKKLTERPISY